MGRTAAVIVALLAAVAALLWFLLGPGRERTAIPSVPEPSAAAVVAAEPVAPAADIDTVTRGRVDAEPTLSEIAAAPVIPESLTGCVVIGRVVDLEGIPIAGAQVRLYASKVWAEGHDVPRLVDRFDIRGFEVSSAASGDFRIEAPVPTAARTVLTIKPDRFHDSHTLYFAATGDRVQPPLLAGERNLGEIRLARTGALVGRVIDTHGQPIADVDIGIGETRVSTLGRNARTGEDGSFVVAHAPAGTYGVHAKSERYLAHFEPLLTVEAGRETPVKDIVLAAAPTIEGIVLDETGRPLEGVRIWGWPASSGRGAGANSGADGRFILYLPQDEPYSISAKLDGHLTWGDEHDKSAQYAPGRRDLEIVMRTLARTRFTVVDAGTGQPIERFGLNILEDNGSLSPSRVSTEKRPPAPQLHAGGVAEATARAGIDAYVIAADGYLLAVGDVEHEVAGVPAQTVPMQRGAALRGRVLRDGRSVADVPVEIVRITGRDQGVDGTLEGGRYYIDANTRRTIQTDAEGRFELAALQAGEHRLTVRPAQGAPLVIAPVHVPHEKTLDLGDLPMLAGATIEGQLIVPVGIAPAGCTIWLDDWREGSKALVDGAGAFRFENVPPGVRYLALAERPGELAAGTPQRVEIVAGEKKSVTIDARDRAMCTVDLRIDLGDVPVAGTQVSLIRAAEPMQTETVGNCDATGRVRGSVRAFGAAHVTVWLPGSRRVQHPSALVELQPLGQVEATVRFEFARLEVRLPRGVALPSEGRVQLRFVPHDGVGAEQGVWLDFANGAAVGETPLHIGKPGGLSIGALIAGRQAVTVELVDTAVEPVKVEMGDGRHRMEQRPYYSKTVDVVLVAGRTVELVLE